MCVKYASINSLASYRGISFLDGYEIFFGNPSFHGKCFVLYKAKIRHTKIRLNITYILRIFVKKSLRYTI